MSLHLAADATANYERFISRVRLSGLVWGLRSGEGWAVCPSNDGSSVVFPFWSDEAYARNHCKQEWASYEAVSISLEQFQANWLPGMSRDGVLVGAQFNLQLAGLELLPSQVAEDLASGL